MQILKPDAYLRPDMNANVKFLADENKHTSSQPQGVFVPTPAIRDRDGKKFVFLSFEGKAIAREVKILSQRSGGVLVQGLNGGEDVVSAALPTGTYAVDIGAGASYALGGKNYVLIMWLE